MEAITERLVLIFIGWYLFVKNSRIKENKRGDVQNPPQNSMVSKSADKSNRVCRDSFLFLVILSLNVYNKNYRVLVESWLGRDT